MNGGSIRRRRGDRFGIRVADAAFELLDITLQLIGHLLGLLELLRAEFLCIFIRGAHFFAASLQLHQFLAEFLVLDENIGVLLAKDRARRFTQENMTGFADLYRSFGSFYRGGADLFV